MPFEQDDEPRPLSLVMTKKIAANRANSKTAIVKCWRHSSETCSSRFKLLVLDSVWDPSGLRLFVSQPAWETIPEASPPSPRAWLAAPLHAPPWRSPLPPQASPIPRPESERIGRDGRTSRPLCRRILARLVQPILSDSVDPGPVPTAFRPLFVPFPQWSSLGMAPGGPPRFPSGIGPASTGPDRLRPQQPEGSRPLPLAAPAAPGPPARSHWTPAACLRRPILTSAERGTAAPVPELMMPAARGCLVVFFPSTAGHQAVMPTRAPDHGSKAAKRPGQSLAFI